MKKKHIKSTVTKNHEKIIENMNILYDTLAWNKFLLNLVRRSIPRYYLRFAVGVYEPFVKINIYDVMRVIYECFSIISSYRIEYFDAI